tara:strand:- start:3685 stop:3831 length:147 start_codon:yes stop_codon:yes gene_type:complete
MVKCDVIQVDDFFSGNDSEAVLQKSESYPDQQAATAEISDFLSRYHQA